MRPAWMTMIALLAFGCGDSVETASVGYTTGGEGKPVGPSRVARPLPEAGPRANYPEPQDTFGLAPSPADPMMEDAQTEVGNCPAEIENVRVDVTDIYDGAAIILTAENGRATAIQASARAMTASHLAQQAQVAEAPEPAGSEPAEGMGKPDAIAMPAVRTEVVDLAEGARISYFAQDPDEVIEVRNAVRRLASAMEGGSCAASPQPEEAP